MQTQKPLPFGNQVRITSHGPFRGLNGTIIQIDTIIDDLEEPFCFYLIALKKTSVAEAIWFEYHEVEFIGTPPSSPAFPAQIRPVGLRKDMESRDHISNGQAHGTSRPHTGLAR